MPQSQTKKILKLIVKQYINQYNPDNSKTKQFFEASVLNNLATIYLQEQHSEKAVLYSEQALQRIEYYIVQKIKNNSNDIAEAQKDTQFIQDLMILLYGYLNMGRAIASYKENLPYFQNSSSQQLSPTQSIMQSKSNPFSFFQNGFTMSKQYLGKKHYLTKKFYNLAKNYQNQQEKGQNSSRSNYKIENNNIKQNLWVLWNNQFDKNITIDSKDDLQNKINRIYMIQRQSWQKGIKYQFMYQNNVQSMESSAKSNKTIKQQRRSSELIKNQQGDIFFGQQNYSNGKNQKFQVVGSTNNNNNQNNMQSSSKRNSIKKQQSNENSPLPTPNFIIKNVKPKKEKKKDDSLNDSRPITRDDVEGIMMNKLQEIKKQTQNDETIKLTEKKLQSQQEKLDQIQQLLEKLQQENKIQQKDSQEKEQEIKNLKSSILQINQSSSQHSMQTSTPQNHQKIKKQESIYSSQQLSQGNASPQKQVIQQYQQVQQQQPQQFQTQSSLTPTSSINRPLHSQSPTNQNNAFPQIQNQLMAPRRNSQNPMNYSSQQMRRQTNTQNTNIINPMEGPQIHPEIFKQREIIVKKHLQVNDEIYIISICLSKNNLEHNFLISGTSLKTQKALQDRTLKNDVLQYILAIVDLQDTMAYNQQIHTVSNFIDFCKFFMFPFISVELDPESKQSKIEMHPKSFGVVQENWESTFLGENVLLYLNYIDHTNFRLVINNNKTGEVTRIDIQFDNTTFYKCFEVENKEFNQRKQEIEEFKELVKYIEELETEKINQSNIDLLTEKHNARKNNKVFELDNIIIKDKQNLREELQKLLKTCEAHIQKNIAQNYRQYQEDIHFKFIKCYVYDSLQKARIFLIREHTYNREYEIYLKNHHITHGLQGKLINAEGSKTIAFQDFSTYFGVRQELLQDHDKQTLCSILFNLFALKEFHSEISEIDAYCYEENAIQEEAIEVVCHEKYLYHGPYNYKSPIICSYIGGQNKPFGIKVTIYDPVDIKEHGIFITIDEFKWLKEIVMESYVIAKKKKFARQQVQTESEITKNYNFTHFLTKVGWEPIQNSFDVKHNSNNYLEIKGKKNINKQHQMVYRAEEIVNIEQFLNSLKEQVQEQLQLELQQ